MSGLFEIVDHVGLLEDSTWSPEPGVILHHGFPRNFEVDGTDRV
jgi:hypothetical protein